MPKDGWAVSPMHAEAPKAEALKAEAPLHANALKAQAPMPAKAPKAEAPRREETPMPQVGAAEAPHPAPQPKAGMPEYAQCGGAGDSCPLSDRKLCKDTQYLACATEGFHCQRQNQWCAATLHTLYFSLSSLLVFLGRYACSTLSAVP